MQRLCNIFLLLGVFSALSLSCHHADPFEQRVTYVVHSERPGLRIDYCAPNGYCFHRKTKSKNWKTRFKRREVGYCYRIRAATLTTSDAWVTVEVFYGGVRQCSSSGVGGASCFGRL